MISYRSIRAMVLISITLVGSTSGAFRGFGAFGARWAASKCSVMTVGKQVQAMPRNVKSFLDRTQDRRWKVGCTLGLSGLAMTGSCMGLHNVGIASETCRLIGHAGLIASLCTFPIGAPVGSAVGSAVVASIILIYKRLYDAYWFEIGQRVERVEKERIAAHKARVASGNQAR